MKTLKLNYLCSTDSLRPSMNYIQFNDNGYIYATDGHVLIKTTMHNVFGTEFNALKNLWINYKEIHIHATEWKKIAGKDLISCEVLIESDNKAIVQFRDKKTEYTVTFLTSDFEIFPKCENIIPSGQYDVSEIGINAAYMNQLFMCVKGSTDTAQFKLNFTGENKTVLLTHAELEDTTFILMPFFIKK